MNKLLTMFGLGLTVCFVTGCEEDLACQVSQDCFKNQYCGPAKVCLDGSPPGADMSSMLGMGQSQDQSQLEDMNPPPVDLGAGVPVFVNLPRTVTVPWGRAGSFEARAMDSDTSAEGLTYTLKEELCGLGVMANSQGKVDFTCKPEKSTCTATLQVSDGQSSSEGTLTISCVNTAPKVDNVRVDPAPKAGQSTTCLYDFQDAEGDEDKSTVAWFVNGQSVGSGKTFGQYQAGDKVQCRVTPFDGLEQGMISSSAEVDVPNSAFIIAGGAHSCRVINGRAECWGDGKLGQLGRGSFLRNPDFSAQPQVVSGLQSGVTAITAGDDHTCAIHNGAAKCWGANDFGQLGDNKEAASSTPVQVAGLGSGVTAIAAGGNTTCAIHNGAAKCWGEDGDNTNVLGTFMNNLWLSRTPVQVVGLNSGVTAIAVGEKQACAVHNGAVKCWGAMYGGNATNGPSPLGGLSGNVTKMLAGLGHVCALVSGELWCWGENAKGQLGDGGTRNNFTPQKAFGLNDKVSDFSTGYDFSCAIFDKVTKCWGSNRSGQLGDGSTVDSLTPVTVRDLTANVTSLSSGGAHSCAIDGAMTWCWGVNASKQLGR